MIFLIGGNFKKNSMLNFYKKIFRIFCRVSDNPSAGGGTFPENSAYIGTAVLCNFNLIEIFLLIKGIVFQQIWTRVDQLILGILCVIVFVYFYFIFLHNKAYKEYVSMNKNIQRNVQKKENWLLFVYIICTLILLVMIPLLIRKTLLV